MANAKAKKAAAPRVVIDGAKPRSADLGQIPNSMLKDLLRAGSDDAWDEAVDRIAKKIERGDYGDEDEDQQ